MKVLLVAGSSGGHIFPALALSEGLRGQGCETLLVIPRKNSVTEKAVAGSRVAYISVEAIGARVSPAALRGAARFVLGCWEAMRVVSGFSPDVAVGFGSIASIPVMLLCWLFRIRTVLHEQNVSPGRANRFLARFCDRICVSFEESGRYFSEAASKVVVTGNPLRSRMKPRARAEALSFFSFDGQRRTVLVTGGSQGSARINGAWLRAVSAAAQPEGIQVIHVCGSDDAESLAASYGSLGIRARVFNFLEEMEYAFSCADLAVCRAGATTIAELAAFRVPAVIIPYPHAAAHQAYNARIVQGQGSALVIDDKDLDSGALAAAVKGLLSVPERLAGMRARYGAGDERTALAKLVHVVLDRGVS